MLNKRTIMNGTIFKMHLKDLKKEVESKGIEMAATNSNLKK